MIDEGVDFEMIEKLENDFFKISGRRLAVPIPPIPEEENKKVIDVEIPF